VNYLAAKVIASTIFESLSILVIVVNSIFLALEDPTSSVQAGYLKAVNGSLSSLSSSSW
jgi:hypothetical protein